MKELNANDLDQVAGGVIGPFTQTYYCTNKDCEYGKKGMFGGSFTSKNCPKCGQPGTPIIMG